MICPECKAEYREGFTKCADCEVELVPATPVERGDSSGDLAIRAPLSNAGGSDEDPFCLFWKGEDPRVFAELQTVLEEAGIPYRHMEWQDNLFNRMKFPEFRLAVPFSLFEKAEKAVAEAYGSVEDADNVMHPLEENREAYRKLLAWTQDEKMGRVRNEKRVISEDGKADWKE